MMLNQEVKGKVAEVFESVQGEGLYLGEKQIFVRLFGCNLDCGFCDTKLNCFSEYRADELFHEILMYSDNYHSIAFTGGEPLLQKDFLKEILKLTHGKGYKNYLETNGTLPQALEETIDYLDIVAMDLKLPSSTGLRHFWDSHRKFLETASKKEVFLKAVICSATTESDLREAIKLIREVNQSAILVLQPNSGDEGNGLAQKLEHFRNICVWEDVASLVIPQMHKIAGVE